MKLMKELLTTGVKCNKEEIIFVAKDKDGQLVWLEKGNDVAGLTHIINRHADDYKKAFGIEVDDIPSFLENVISNGTILTSTTIKRNGSVGYRKVYDYNGEHCVISGIGTNGFIVTAFPAEKEGE